MITPTMSPLEVARDARHDIRALSNKLKPIAHAQERAHRKGDRALHVDQLFRWRSPRGNNWMVVISTNKQGSRIAPLVWYRGTDDRLRACHVDLLGNATNIHYAAHVLERYMERFDPNRNSVERLADFFLANYNTAIHSAEDLGQGRHNVVVASLHGHCQGYGDTNTRLIELTTFVDPGHFFPDQVELDEVLDFERYANRLTPGQRLEFLKQLEAELERRQNAA